MKQLFHDKSVTKLIWCCLILSAALLAWQTVAFVTGNIPEHILSLVVLLSGTQESVPIAYSWTFMLGFISVTGILASSIYLILQKIMVKK